jgi:hypothetical protein
VTYGERMALPPDAVVEVTLSDVSVQDAAASIIAQATVVAAGREVPLPFELRYDPKKIHPTGWYAMRAAIRREGRLIFTSDTVYRVITHGNPTQVDLHLVRVGDGADSRSGGAARVEAIRADLASYRAVQGTGAAGDDGAAWIAYFDGAALRRIDETSGQGHDGTAENEYYFESGKLVAYVSRETRAVTDPGRRERSGSRSASPSIRPGPKRSSRRPWTADPPHRRQRDRRRPHPGGASGRRGRPSSSPTCAISAEWRDPPRSVLLICSADATASAGGPTLRWDARAPVYSANPVPAASRAARPIPMRRAMLTRWTSAGLVPYSTLSRARLSGSGERPRPPVSPTLLRQPDPRPASLHP